MKCPYCGKQAQTDRGLVKHLTGTKRYGGHELSVGEALQIAAGGHPPRLPDAKGAAPSTRPKAPEKSTISNSGNTPSSVADVPRLPLSGDFLRDYFATIVRNKALPKYQFERRIDALVAMFLPDILATKYGWSVDVVVPEFPIKHPYGNQTTNADYALFRRATSTHVAAWILFELKTDATSLNESQLPTYQRARERGMPTLRAELDEVLGATQHRLKYRRLLERLDVYPLDSPIEILFLTPGNSGDALRGDGLHVLSFRDLLTIELPNYSEAWEKFRAIVLPALE